MLTTTRILAHTLQITLAAALSLTLSACDDLPEGAATLADPADDLDAAREGSDDSAEDEALEGSAALDLRSEPQITEAGADSPYFRLMSERKRGAKNLCFEPLSDIAGSPVLQRECTNNPLSANNRQAFFQPMSMPDHIQYAVKDLNSGETLCLHMTGGAPSVGVGVAAVLYPCKAEFTNQQFLASTPGVNGSIALMARHSHRCLTVFGALTTDEALLYQFGIYLGTGSCPAAHERWHLRTEMEGDFQWTPVAPEGWPKPACV